jgi:predicted MFS family arabinose efflux permease
VFYVNLPVGLLGAAWALRTLPEGGVARGGPLLDLELFRLRVFTWGLLAGFLSYAAMFTQTLLTPFFLTRVLGLEPAAVGVVMVSVPVAMSVSSPASGWISDRFGGRWLPVVGMGLLALALVSLSLAAAGASLAGVAARLALCGVGMGLFQSPNNAAVMSALPRARLGSGGGLLATARNGGMAAGIAIAALLVARVAGGEAAGPGFLAGYALALRAGAVIAAGAAIVSLVGAREKRIVGER